MKFLKDTTLRELVSYITAISMIIGAVGSWYTLRSDVTYNKERYVSELEYVKEDIRDLKAHHEIDMARVWNEWAKKYGK